MCYPAGRGCAISSNTKVAFSARATPFPIPLTRTLLLDSKVVYRRYASLFFIAGCASTDNELITLEVVHRYVEQMDKYYGNVCELDIIFNFQKAYFILDELLIAGEMQETSKKNVLRCISQQDSLEDMEVSLPVPMPYQTPAILLSPCLSVSSYCKTKCPSLAQPWPCFSRANFPRLRKMWLPRSCRAKQVLAQYIGVYTNQYNLFRIQMKSPRTYTALGCDCSPPSVPWFDCP